MDTSKTVFSKGQRNGWQGMDTIQMGPALNHHGEPATRVLTISTWKSSRGGIQTVANCALHADGMTMTDIFGDYRKTVAKLDNRCTEKSVRQLHTAVMEQQGDALLIEARAFYEAKDATRALHAKRDAELAAVDAKVSEAMNPRNNQAQTLTVGLLDALQEGIEHQNAA